MIQKLKANMVLARAALRALSAVPELKIEVDRLRRGLSDLMVETLRASHPRYREPERLLASGRKYFSQNDEDGILEEIFRRAGEGGRYFVEIGSGDGGENNSLYLLLKGWRGLWIEADTDCCQLAKERFADWTADDRLTILRASATAENIEEKLKAHHVPPEFDLLSIDIDGNDYHVLAALGRFRPRVIAVEYNAFFGPSADVVMRYRPDYRWDGSNAFGASLKALERLGDSLGYHLVGCNISGINAFFVRKDLTGAHFCQPYTAENHFEPCRSPQITFASNAYRSSLAGLVIRPSADTAPQP